MFVGQASASADFYGPFAPSEWTFAGNAAANSLTSSQMQITSFNAGGGSKTASYTVEVPSHIWSISFDYHYQTNDDDGSRWDMAKYAIDGVSIDISPNNLPTGGTSLGKITLSNLSGKTFAIIQDTLDSAEGSGVITITDFSASIAPDYYLVGVSAPVLLVDSSGQASCTPGTYKSTNGSAAEVNSFVYTLFVNNQPVSRMAVDPTATISPHLFAPITHSVQGVTTGSKITWDISKLTNFDARCEVTVAHSGSLLTTSSNEFTDAVKLVESNAKAQAWENQRAAANAANFTKEAREMRKRIASRSSR